MPKPRRPPSPASSSEEQAGDGSDDSGPEELPARRRVAQQPGSDSEHASASSSGGGDCEGAADDAQEESSRSSDGPGSEPADDGATLEQRAAALERALADIPFETLERLQTDGAGPRGAAARAAAYEASQRSFHRENKNRPQELSSKRPVSRFREVIQVPKAPSKDPRFDATIGGKPFDKDAYAKRYAFLYDEVLPGERARLREALKKEKREGRRRELQAQLTRVQQQLADERGRRKGQELEKSWKSQEKAAVAAGKKPFFLSKKEKRRRELVAKYEELKAAGQLDKYMEKRRRKNASKDHRYVPRGRRD